jgi:hypothetical protein
VLIRTLLFVIKPKRESRTPEEVKGVAVTVVRTHESWGVAELSDSIEWLTCLAIANLVRGS